MKLETKVGAFFVGALVILGVLILRTGKLEMFGNGSQRTFHTTFPQVAGLAVQGHVRIAGVKVGEVRTIELKDGQARVLFTVEEGVPVSQGATASLSSIGILGEKYIELDPGRPPLGPWPEETPIPSKTGVSLDNLMETLGAIGQDVKGITSALNASIGGEQGREKLDEIVDNIRVLTAEFRAMAQENNRATFIHGDWKTKTSYFIMGFGSMAWAIGVGGGKIFDTAKAVAYKAGIPVIICPTIASTDAPCTALEIGRAHV